PGGPTRWAPPTTNPSASIEGYTTIAAPPTWTGPERATSAPDLPRAISRPDITGTPRIRAARRRFPLSYALAALVVVACLVVFGLRVLPGLMHNGNATLPNSASNNATAQAFDDQSQDNHLNWQTGTIAPGVTLSTPAAGAYISTISTSTTAFPYPQAVGSLPDTFTLTTTLQQTAGAPDNAYGLAFHFTQDTSGHVTCYAFVIVSNGSYALYEYIRNNPITIATGSYQTGAQAHTLTVKAQGDTYSFAIDRQALQITLGAQAPAATWSNSDLHGGHLALLLAGPASGETNASFKATNVQLSIP